MAFVLQTSLAKGGGDQVLCGLRVTQSPGKLGEKPRNEASDGAVSALRCREMLTKGTLSFILKFRIPSGLILFICLP